MGKVSLNKKGSLIESAFKKFLETQGYIMERTYWSRFHHHDFFGLFDLIGIQERGIKIFVQVKSNKSRDGNKTKITTNGLLLNNILEFKEKYGNEKDLFVIAIRTGIIEEKGVKRKKPCWIVFYVGKKEAEGKVSYSQEIYKSSGELLVGEKLFSKENCITSFKYPYYPSRTIINEEKKQNCQVQTAENQKINVVGTS